MIDKPTQKNKGVFDFPLQNNDELYIIGEYIDYMVPSRAGRGIGPMMPQQPSAMKGANSNSSEYWKMGEYYPSFVRGDFF